MNRRSFLGTLLASGVALLVDAEGHALAEPIVVSDERLILFTLVLAVPQPLEEWRAQGGVCRGLRQYFASAKASLGLGERWTETIVVPEAVRLERLIIPSSVAEIVVVHGIRTDARVHTLGNRPLPGQMFDEIALGVCFGAVAEAEITVELERVS